jgi:hypothetical protein
MRTGCHRRQRSFVTGAVIVAAAIVSSTRLPAQSSERAVQAAVEAFLLHLGDHDWDRVGADLAPRGIVIVVRERNGEWGNTFQTTEEWLTGLRRNSNPITFREPITNVKVTVDNDHLAYLRADFQIVRDGKPQSKGVDQFTLVREGGAWKIAAIAYTSLPVGPTPVR